MRRIILCLDGTWNNTYAEEKRDDGSKVVKPSNVLKFARAILPVDQNNDTEQIVYYDIGVGSMSKFPGPTNTLLHYVDRILGGGWGAGFESNIEDAITFLVNNYVKGDQIYICGFSRGAATARALTNFIQWMKGVPAKRDAYYIPELLRYYIENGGCASDFAVVRTAIEKELLKNTKGKQRLEAFNPIEIAFLGVWDTVLSLGGRISNLSHRKFHIQDKPAGCIKHIRHALAIDEKRADFLPSIWTGVSHGGQTLKQFWFPGVHSNIGGGYINDGLANSSFRWMINEIKRLNLGLQFDPKYISYFKPYCQSEMTESFTFKYKIKDLIMRQTGKRNIKLCLSEKGESAGLNVHYSAIQRMLNDPLEKNKKGEKRFPLLSRYRPENLNSRIKEVDCISRFLSDYDKKFDSDSVERIINGGTNYFDAGWSNSSTGIELKYRQTYQVSLKIITALSMNEVKFDFSGRSLATIEDNQYKLRMLNLFRRVPSANLFSLIGDVNGEKIDLGQMWEKAAKTSFTFSLAKLFPDKEVAGKLYVCLNSMIGSYRNFQGAYTISLTVV